ncbi:MAG: hypothetical protein IJB86_08295 [Clostridia bacterium]|nr:hypothetical protein [Clostridia bacterium]
MGSSIWLIVIIPVMLIYSIFGNIFTAVFGKPKTELELPFDESAGIVWEYDNSEDYFIELVEVKVENDKQIFVFRDADSDDIPDMVGRLMDLVFTDKNGNRKKYYATESDSPFKGSAFYEESECYTALHTATAINPDDSLHWSVMQESDSVLTMPMTNEPEVTFVIVATPEDLKWMEKGQQFIPIFDYETDDGAYVEYITTEYIIEDGKLVIKYEHQYE